VYFDYISTFELLPNTTYAGVELQWLYIYIYIYMSVYPMRMYFLYENGENIYGPLDQKQMIEIKSLICAFPYSIPSRKPI